MRSQYITHLIGFILVLLVVGLAAGWENGYWDKRSDKIAEPPYVVVDAGEDGE
jgi:hypothetical protein